MKFWMPLNLEELAEALREKNEDTYLCAGGTDLVIHLRKKEKFHYSLIDLTHLPELAEISETKEELYIGAGVTMTELEQSPLVHKYIPALGTAAGMVGSTQIRNRATIGGNIANASQSSDTMPVLLAYDAQAVIFNEKGEKRSCPVDDVMEGLEKNLLSEREVILAFTIPKKDTISGFFKVGSRKAVTISKINGCIRLELEAESHDKIKNAVVCLGAVGAKAGRAGRIEACLTGQSLKQLDEAKVRESVYEQIEENIPGRPSKHYKKSAAFGVVDQILEDLRKEMQAYE